MIYSFLNTGLTRVNSKSFLYLAQGAQKENTVLNPNDDNKNSKA